MFNRLISEHFYYVVTKTGTELLLADFNFEEVCITITINISQRKVSSIVAPAIDFKGEKVEFDTAKIAEDAYIQALKDCGENIDPNYESPFKCIDVAELKAYLKHHDLFDLFISEVRARGDSDLKRHINEIFYDNKSGVQKIMINKNEAFEELLENVYVIRIIVALIDQGYEVSIEEVESWIGEGNVVQKINEYAEKINIKKISSRVKLVEVLRASTLSSDNPKDYNVSENGFCYLIAKLSDCIVKELDYYKNGNLDF